MRKFVVQQDARAERPTIGVAILFYDGVLRTGSGSQAHPAGDVMLPPHIDDVVIKLAARIFRKLKQLISVDYADLIVPRNQMAVPGLNRDLVTVEQSIGRVVKMSVAESPRRRNRGNRIDG